MLRSILCLFLIMGLLFPANLSLAAYAEDPVPPAADNSAGGLNLDLGSTERNVAASTVLNSTASATINIGGLSRVVSAADMLTAAELVAVRQVMNTGTQYLQLNDLGAAIGGGMRLNASLASQINSLVIPTGVHATQNAAVLQTLNLTGNFSNSGVYSILSSNSAINSATINAANIYNNAGGLMSSALANLTLNAVNNIVNAGMITSAGNLNMSAGGSITNLGQLAVMQAMNNMNLQATNIVNQGVMAAQLGNLNAVTANLSNSGIIQALNNSLSVQNLYGSQLSVNSVNGVMTALKDLSFVTQGPQFDELGRMLAKPEISLTGGTLSGQNINFTTPEGGVHVHAYQLNGAVNISGGAANLGVDAGNLYIASQVLTGDPIYYNVGGDLDLSGVFNESYFYTRGDFVALAGGNITAGNTNGDVVVDSRSLANVPGGIILIGSGLDFSVSNSNCNPCIAGVDYTINGPSATGGNIELSNVSFVSGDNGITLQASGGCVGCVNPGSIAVNGLSAPGADIVITADSDVTLGSLPSVAGSNFTIVSGGNITNLGTISANDNVLLSTTGNGNINLRNSIFSHGTIELNASGTGTINQTQTYGVVNGVVYINVLSAPNVILTSDTGDIGDSLDLIQLKAFSLSANSNGDVYLSGLNNGTLTVGASSAGAASDFLLMNNRHLTTTGAITAGNITLYAYGESGTINLQDNLTASGTVAINAGLINNEGTISGSSISVDSNRNLVISGGGNMSAATIQLSASSGGGSVIASQNSIVGTLNSQVQGNFLVHLDDATGFVMGTLSTSMPVSSTGPDFFGGTTYYAAQFSQVFDSGGLVVLSTNPVGPTVSATIDGSHNITGTLSVTDTLDGDITIFMRDPLTGDLTVSSSGMLVVSNDYSPLTIQSLDSNVNNNFLIATNIVIAAGASITTTGTISGGIAQLNAYDGGITVGDNITAAAIYLIAPTTTTVSNIVQTGGTLSSGGGGEVLAMTGNGSISLPSIDSSSLVMFGSGNIDVHTIRTSFTFLDEGVSTGGDLTVSADGSLWVDNFVYANGSINLETLANFGSIQFAQMLMPVYAGGLLNLNSDNSIVFQSGSNAVLTSATGVTLTANAGSIGDTSEEVITNAPFVQLTLNSSEQAYVANYSGLPVALDASSAAANSSLQFIADSDINITGGLSGEDIVIGTTATSDGSINAASNITATSSLTLTTHRWGGVTQSLNTVLLTAPTVTINTGLGNVGSLDVISAVTQPLRIDAGNLVTNSAAQLTVGGVGLGGTIAIGEWIIENLSADLNLSGTGAAMGNPFILETAGNVTVTSGSTISGYGCCSAPIGQTGVKITAGGTITIEAGASIQSPVYNSGQVIELYTSHLTNNGIILTADNLIVQNPSGNLTIDGNGSMSIILPNSNVGIQGFVQLIGGPGASVNVHQGSIDGIVVSGVANFGFAGDFVTDTSPLPVDYSIAVDSGVLRVNHIVASGQITLNNSGGDINVLEFSGSQGVVQSTTSSITITVGDSYRVFLTGGSNPTIIDAATDLTIEAGYFSNNSSYVLDSIFHVGGALFYDYLNDLPGVHAVNSVTITNLTGNLVVSGYGGIWTGTGTADSSSYGTIGTGTINFYAPNGSVIANQQLLMGTVNVTTSTSGANPGLVMLSVGLPDQYSFDGGLTVSPSASFIQGSFTYFDAPCALTPCVNTNPNLGSVTVWAAPSAMTVGDLLVLSQAISATPLSPTDVIYIAAAGVQDTGGPFGETFACGGCYSYNLFNGTAQVEALKPGLMIVHATEPITAAGNWTISNTQGGGLYIDTGSFGAIQTDDNGTYDITITSGPGNLVVNGTGVDIIGAYSTNFTREIYTLGAINVSNTGGDFINNGATFLGGSVSLNNEGGRLLTGFVTGTSAFGDVNISNVGGNLDIVGAYQTGLISSARNVQISNSVGDMWLNSGSVGAVNNIVLTSSVGALKITNAVSVDADTGDLEINYDGSLQIANFVSISGENISINSSSSPSNQLIIQAANITAFNNITVNNTGDIYLQNGGNLNTDLSGLGSTTVNNVGNIVMSYGAGISASGSSPGGNVTVNNSNGDISVLGQSGFNGSINGGNVAIANSNGDITISDFANVTALAGSVSVSNSNGDIVISNGATLSSGAFNPGTGSTVVSNLNGSLTIDTSSPMVGAYIGPTLESSGTILVTNDQDVVITGDGYDALQATSGVLLVSTAGNVSVSQQLINSKISGQSEGQFNVSTVVSGLTIGSVTANADGLSIGTITLQAGTGTLTVLGSVVSNLSSVTLQNITGGYIALGENSLVSALNGGTTYNNIYIVSGGVPGSGLAGATPGNLVVGGNPGLVYFGGQSISTSPPDNHVTAVGGQVIFNASDVSLISMNGNATINTSDPAIYPVITSLDLTDPAVVSRLVAMQSLGLIGGTLQTSGGIAVGGNAIIAPNNLAAVLTAQYVPDNVTLTMQNFTSGNTISVQLTGSSSTSQVIVAGTQEFLSTGGNSSPLLSIFSNQTGPVFVLERTGLMTSDSDLAIETNGDMMFYGLAEATNITLATTNGGNVMSSSYCGTCVVRADTLNLQVSGSIGSAVTPFSTEISNLNGLAGDVHISNFGDLSLDFSQIGGMFQILNYGNLTVNSFLQAGDIDFRTTSGSHDITLNTFFQATNNVNLQAYGGGNIVQLSGSIAAESVSMSTGPTGSIGSSLQPISVQVNQLAASAGNVYVSSSNFDLQLNSSSADQRDGNFGVFELTTSGRLTIAANANVYGGTVTLTDGFESIVQAGAVVQSFGTDNSVNWNTSSLTNEGAILGQYVSIQSNSNLTVTGTGRIGINNMPNSGVTFSGVQALVSFVSLSGGDVNVNMGRIDGLISSSRVTSGAFSFSCFCFVADFTDDSTPPANFSVSVSGGALYANHINAVSSLSLTNTNGDIRIYGQTGWSPGIIATSAGDITLDTNGGHTILLDRGSIIDSANDLTISTSYFYNNTSAIFMSGNPAVHAVNDIIFNNNPGMGISGTGGMWTGTAGAEGTGSINFNSANGSIIITSALLMGTVNIAASTTDGLFLLDVADTTNFTAGTMAATAPSGFPSPFSATYGTTGITYWQAPSSMNMIDPNPTQGGGLLVLSTVVPVDPSNPSGDTMEVLIDGNQVIGGPTGVTFPVSCGGSCVNYTVDGMEILSTLEVSGLQSGLLVVHSNMPTTVNGDITVNNTGNTIFNTSTLGVLQTCDGCTGATQPGIAINSSAGALVMGGGRGGFASLPNLVTLGALNITTSGGPFIEYGLVQGGSISIIGSSSRLFTGDMQSTAGDFIIVNSGQIDLFNVAATGGGVSIVHNGAGYIDMNFSSIVSTGNLTAGTGISVLIVDNTSNGGLSMSMGSSILTNSGGALTISINGGTIETNTGARIVSSGTLNINCGTCQSATVFNNSILASFGDLTISNGIGDMEFNATNVYTSNADIYITNNGNLTFDLPTIVRGDQLIFVDTLFGPFPYTPYKGGNVYVTNTGGDLTVSNGALIAGSNLISASVSVVNSGGDLNLVSYGRISAEDGRGIVRNTGGDFNIGEGSGISVAGDGILVDNYLFVYNSGGSMNFATNPSQVLFASPSYVLVMNDQDISLTGYGVNSIDSLHVTFISTAGQVNLSQRDMSTTSISGQSATDFTARVSNGSMNIDTILANNGSVTLTAANPIDPLLNGTIVVNSGATIVANNGTVLIQTCEAGDITIGQNAVITALNGSGAFGDVYIVSGALPASPSAGVNPANVTVSTASGGQVYFGDQGITASAPENFVTAIGGNVIFDAADVADIMLGGNVSINLTQAGVSPLLTSLDMQDTTTVDQLVSLQGLGLIGGTLDVSGGVVVGGTAFISASRIAPLLTAVNLPADTTIEFQNFGSIFRPITVSLTATSTTSQVLVGSSVTFSDGSTSQVYMNVLSDQAGPAVVISAAANVVSDSLLSLTSNRAINAAGLLSAFDQLTVETVEAGGDVVIGGYWTGRNVLRVEVDGGDISQAAGLLTGNSIYLQSHSGNIGSSSARISAISYDNTFNELRAQATGDAYLTYQGDVSLERSIVGDNFTLDLTTTCDGTILINGDYVLGGTINLTADGIGGIFSTFSNNNFEANTINLASGVGDIGGPNGPSGSDLTVGTETFIVTANTGGNVYIQQNFLVLCLGCPSGTSDIRPQPPASTPTTLYIGSSRAGNIMHISAGNLGVGIVNGATVTVVGQADVLGDLSINASNNTAFEPADLTIGNAATLQIIGSGVITINANALDSIVNNGTISTPFDSTSGIVIDASSVTGTGVINGMTTVSGNTVLVDQASINGPIGGTSFGGDFDVTVSSNLLQVGSISSAGNITISNTGGDIYVSGTTVDANIGTGTITMSTTGSFGVLIETVGLNAADMIFNTAHFAGDFNIVASNSITISNTGSLVMGLNGNLQAPTMTISSTNGSVTAWMIEAIGTTINVSAPNNLLVDIRYVGGVGDATINAISPYAVNTITNVIGGNPQFSGGTVTYAANSAQVFFDSNLPGAALIVLNSTGTAANVTVNGSTVASGSNIAAGSIPPCCALPVFDHGVGTISGDFGIDNSAGGDLTVHLGEALYVTGNTSVSNNNGNLVWDGGTGYSGNALIGDGNITIANGDNGSSTPGGDLTVNSYGAFFPNLATSAFQLSNNSGNLTFMDNSFVFANGGVSVTNFGGNIKLDFQSYISGGGYIGTACATCVTAVTNSGGSIIAYASQFATLGVGFASSIDGYGGLTTVSNSGGNLILGAGGAIQSFGDNLEISNNNGNIVVDGAWNNTGWSIIASDTATAIDVSQDGPTGDIVISNGGSIVSIVGAVNLSTNAGHYGNILITGSGSYISGAGGVTIDHSGTGDITVTNTGHIGLNLETIQLNTTAGDIIVSNVGSLLASSTLSVTANNGDVILNTGAQSIADSTITISATNGSVVIDSTPFLTTGVAATQVNPSTLVSANGDVSISADYGIVVTGYGDNSLSAVNGTINFASSGGSVSVTQFGLTSVITGSAATTFAVTATNSSLNVGNISTNPSGLNPDGSITLTAGCICPPAGATTLTVTADSIITARKGNVILRNADVVQGSIFLDTNSEVNARQLGSSFGNVYIVVGTVPVSPVAGVTPANVISNPTLGGQVFYGANGLTGNAPDNIVNAPGTLVVFDGPNSSAITMNGNVEINSVPVITLTSLDLTDPTVTSDILALIAQGDIGGNLIVNGSGVATAGSIVIVPGVLSSTITAENIPDNVTIQFQGFGSGDVLAIDITGTSTTKQVVISGVHEYVNGGSPSDAVINVTSNQAGPVFQITGTGYLLSDGSLTVTTTGGDFSSAGEIIAGGAVSITSDAGVTLNNLTAAGNLTVTAQAGSITQTGFVDTSFTGANGNGGDITYQATTGISGVSLNALGGLTTGNGGTILVNTTGGSIAFSSFIDSAARGGGRGGNVTLTADQDITIRSVNAIGGLDPNVNARGGDILIQTTTGSLIATGASPRFVDSSGSQFSAGTSIADAGTITVITPGGIVGTGGALSFRAEGARGGGNGANIVITTSGTAELDFVSSSASTVSPLLTAAGDAGDVTITADGGMTLVDVRAQGGVTSGSGGDVNLTTSGGGVNVGLFIFANSPGATGDGGSVTVNADNDVVIGNIGGLSISTFGGSLTGNSQTVSIDSANGSVSISGLTNTSVTTVGNAGAISVTAETGILSGGLSAAGGTTSGDGANVTAATNNGDLTITSFVSSRGKGQGNGGDVALTALNGTVAVLGTIATGAAIASNGGGTGDAGRIDILYGASTPFVIDPAGVGITNGARGSVTALATDSGDGNVVTIQNVNDDTLVTLNGTIDVTSVSGTGGLIWFVGSTGFSTTVTGNSSGLINGELIGSGDNFSLTLTRPDTALIVAAVNSAGLISINNSVGTSSIVIPLGANISGDGAGVTLTSASIVNDGLLSAIAGQVTLNNSGNLAVTGTGTISGLTASFSSTTGSVTASQATISSTLSGSAQTNFAATATASGLTVDAISATVNTVTLNATGGLLAVVDNGSISAGQSVSLTGGTGVSIGNTVQITGGIVGGGLDEFSLDMLAYTYAQIASPGGILITSTTGNIVTGNGVVMNAFGSSIGFTSAGDLTFGNLNTLFAQGANVWMQASDNLTIPDAAITSVARYIPGTVTIDGIITQNFTGGGIAVFAGVSLPDYNAYLKTTAVDDRVQSDTGTYINNGATVIGGGAVLTNGAWVGLEAPAGGVLNLTNVVLAADGGVISIDPPGIINITGAVIGAIGPAIIPVPQPPVQQAQQAQAPAAQNPFLGAVLPGNGPVNLPPDGTAIQTDVSDFASPVEKNASQVMSRTAQIETVVTQSAAWVFVSGNCQPFLAQSDDSLLFGCGGTMFASNEKTGGVTMREGRLVMLTANKVLKLDSQVGDVTIPSDSAGIVEQKPNGVFRLVSLSGQDAQVTLRHGDDISQVAVRPGEELVVADADMSEEDLIPVDGVDRVAIGGTIRISGLQVKKSQYDKKQMFEREQLIHCGMGSTLLSSYKRRVAKLKEEMTGGAGKVISNAPQAPIGDATQPNTGVIPLTKKDKEKIGSADIYRKIGYDKSETTQISAPGIRAVTTDFGTFKYVGNTNLAFEQPGVVNLTSGELLVASQKATVVRCADHLISVDPGAVALISNDDGFIRVTNLYENSVNAVRACTAGKMISLAAGKQVMFGPTSEHVTRALGADPIARRRSMYFDLPGGKGASRCEISLVSLLQNTPVLTHLLKSTDSNDQALRERLIKMAACLAQTTSTHGPYTTTNGQH